MSKVFTQEGFNNEVIEASKTRPVLVDFYASWCGPCQMQAPIIDELSEELEEKAVIGKLDTEQAMQIAQEYGVMSIPTLIIFRNGEPAERFTGVQSKEILTEALAKVA